jgi:hypothetical protein
MVVYQPATRGDLPTVLRVLDDAAAWLWKAGIRQWPQCFHPAWVSPALERGETWLALIDGSPVGTFTVSWHDAAWADQHDNAGYLHRLAVLRSAAGIGLELVDQASDLVLAAGRKYLRLDCVASNLELCNYYEQAGFRYCGDVDVRGAPGQRLIGEDAPVVAVSRYQRSVRSGP